MELVLFYAVAESVETHVNGFGLILSDCGVDNSIGSAIIEVQMGVGSCG